MERWSGKVAVISGASSGIGLATVKALVEHGLIVVGLARRKMQMEAGMKDVEGPGKFYAVECDITSEESVIEVFKWVKENLGTVNILVNNAGRMLVSTIEDLPTREIEQTIKVNVNGLIYCSKQAIKIMKENQAEAQIININSVVGHTVPPPNPSGGALNVYPATKFAVTALSETLRNELADSKIRVSSISPGLVRTPLITAAASPHSEQVFERVPSLDPEDVANSILHVVGAPTHVQIQELTLQAKHLKARV